MQLGVRWVVCALLAVGLAGCGGGDEAEKKDGKDGGGQASHDGASDGGNSDDGKPDPKKVADNDDKGPGDGGPTVAVTDPKGDGADEARPDTPAPTLTDAPEYLRFLHEKHIAAAIVHPKRLTESELYAALPEGLDMSGPIESMGFDPRKAERVLFMWHGPTDEQIEELRQRATSDRPRFDDVRDRIEKGVKEDKAFDKEDSFDKDTDFEKNEPFPDLEKADDFPKEEEEQADEKAAFDEKADFGEKADSDDDKSPEDIRREFEEEQRRFEDEAAREPAGAGDISYVIWLTEPLDADAYVAARKSPWYDTREVEVAGRTAYQISWREAVLVLDEKTILGGPIASIEEMLNAKQASGHVAAKLLAEEGEFDAFLATDLDGWDEFRRLLRKMFDRDGPKLPGQFQNVPNTLMKVKAASLRADVSEKGTLATITVSPYEGADTDAIHQEVTQAIQLGQQSYNFFVALGTPPDLPEEAKKGLALVTEIVQGVKVSKDGDDVVVTLPHPAGTVEYVKSVGPAILAAQDAAKLARFRNNLKQVGISFHNFHDTYNHMPAAGAFVDGDGKPGLSWRVAILPYIEQGNLYEQMNLEEAWDSETNKNFLEQMPPVYESPGVTEPGMTTMMVLTGEKTAFHGKYEPVAEGASMLRGPQFRNYTDGLSNTILAVYASPEKAVPWTKPADLVFDPAKPIESIGGIPESGLQVLICDGSVRVLSKDIAEDVLRNLAIHNDGNPVEIP